LRLLSSPIGHAKIEQMGADGAQNVPLPQDNSCLPQQRCRCLDGFPNRCADSQRRLGQSLFQTPLLPDSRMNLIVHLCDTIDLTASLQGLTKSEAL
jgi:hypothetical protein